MRKIGVIICSECKRPFPNRSADGKRVNRITCGKKCENIAKYEVHRKDYRVRFDQKYIPEPNSGCWLWTDSLDRDGYGRLMVNGVLQKAHRVSYEIHKGNIPDGLVICHECDNPPCVNPDHLFAGTNQDNTDDLMRKGFSGRKPILNAGATNGMNLFPEEVALRIWRSVKAGARQCDVADSMGISRQTVNDIILGKTWKYMRRD